jgi:hypothetical protein
MFVIITRNPAESVQQLDCSQFHPLASYSRKIDRTRRRLLAVKWFKSPMRATYSNTSSSLILLGYFPYFEEIKVSLWDHIAVCVSMYPPLSLLGNGSIKVPLSLLGNCSAETLPR